MGNIVWIPILGLMGMVFALGTYLLLLKADEGNQKMREIASEIHNGAMYS